MVENNKSHRAYAYRRTGRRHGCLRWSGFGTVSTTKSPEDIAALFKGQPVSPDVVRRILAMAAAHLFVEMVPHHGGTGYYCLLPKDAERPARVPEPDDPREDEHDGDDEVLPDG
jgi:hypothetical protein